MIDIRNRYIILTGSARRLSSGTGETTFDHIRMPAPIIAPWNTAWNRVLSYLKGHDRGPVHRCDQPVEQQERDQWLREEPEEVEPQAATEHRSEHPGWRSHEQQGGYYEREQDVLEHVAGEEVLLGDLMKRPVLSGPQRDNP